MSILNQAAVGCLSGTDAGEVLKAFLDTEPAMVASVHPAAEQQSQQAASAADQIKPR